MHVYFSQKTFQKLAINKNEVIDKFAYEHNCVNVTRINETWLAAFCRTPGN